MEAAPQHRHGNIERRQGKRTKRCAPKPARQSGELRITARGAITTRQKDGPKRRPDRTGQKQPYHPGGHKLFRLIAAVTKESCDRCRSFSSLNRDICLAGLGLAACWPHGCRFLRRLAPLSELEQLQR